MTVLYAQYEYVLYDIIRIELPDNPITTEASGDWFTNHKKVDNSYHCQNAVHAYHLY